MKHSNDLIDICYAVNLPASFLTNRAVDKLSTSAERDMPVYSYGLYNTLLYDGITAAYDFLVIQMKLDGLQVSFHPMDTIL